MKKQTKEKQIVVRFDNPSYERICEHAELEHRGLGDFVRHAVLIYMEEIEGDSEEKKDNKAWKPLTGGGFKTASST